MTSGERMNERSNAGSRPAELLVPCRGASEPLSGSVGPASVTLASVKPARRALPRLLRGVPGLARGPSLARLEARKGRSGPRARPATSRSPERPPLGFRTSRPITRRSVAFAQDHSVTRTQQNRVIRRSNIPPWPHPCGLPPRRGGGELGLPASRSGPWVLYSLPVGVVPRGRPADAVPGLTVMNDAGGARFSVISDLTPRFALLTLVLSASEPDVTAGVGV